MNDVPRSAVPIWGTAAAGAVLVAMIVPRHAVLDWLPVVLAVCVLLTFIVQLGVDPKKGFVGRLTASIGGAIVLLAVATLALGLSAALTA